MTSRPVEPVDAHKSSDDHRRVPDSGQRCAVLVMYTGRMDKE